MNQMWGNVHIEGEVKWKTGNSLLGRKRDTIAHKCPYCGAWLEKGSVCANMETSVFDK